MVGERGVVRVMVLTASTALAPTDIVRRWLATGIRKDPALNREATVEEAFLAFIPFVRVASTSVGWILGARRPAPSAATSG